MHVYASKKCKLPFIISENAQWFADEVNEGILNKKGGLIIMILDYSFKDKDKRRR